MSNVVITADTTASGRIRSRDASYTTARAGGTFQVLTGLGNGILVGQEILSSYDCWEGFLTFDTSGLSAVESVILTVSSTDDQSATDFIVQARTYTWSAGGLTSSDWLAGASISGQTLLATFDTTGWAATNVFTSESAFVSAINTAGATDIMLTSSRHVNGDVPTGLEYVGLSISATLTIEYDTKKIQVVTSNMRW